MMQLAWNAFMRVSMLALDPNQVRHFPSDDSDDHFSGS
jgi:hypothetical protein